MAIDMHEELFVSMLSTRNLVPLDESKVKEERRYYEMTPTISGKWSAIGDLMELYIKAGHYDDAISFCNEVLKNPLLKEYYACLWFWIGQTNEHKEDFEAALDSYLRSIQIGTNNRYLKYWQFNNAGFCYLIRKDWVSAEKHCQIALEIDERTWIEVERRYGEPLNYNAWKNMGVVMEHTDRLNEAASFYITAIKLSRGEKRSVLHLRRLFHRHPELLNWWKEPVEDLRVYYDVDI